MTAIKSLRKDSTTFRNTKIKGQLNIAVFGDVHLGHRNTKTNEIIRKLYRIFPETEETRNLDFIFIEGDLFDHLLYLNNDYMSDIHIWCEWLIGLCNKHQIALRVLEGTPSHDMKQPAILEAMAKKYHETIDFKYADKLDIEFHEKTGATILYLPDEYDSPIENCFTAAKQLVHSHGLKQVDFVCMHGSFDYQLPPVHGIPTHCRSDWESIVKHYILVGHVHFPSQNGKVLAAGSFDRLKHGEEGPKGHLRVTVKNGADQITFVENKEAKLYKTIDISGLDVDHLLEKVSKVIKDAPNDSYFRLSGKKSDGVTTACSYMSDKYPQYNWTDHITEDDVAKTNQTQILENSYQPIHLTRNNLPKLLSDRLNGFYDGDSINRCMKLLEEAL